MCLLLQRSLRVKEGLLLQVLDVLQELVADAVEAPLHSSSTATLEPPADEESVMWLAIAAAVQQREQEIRALYGELLSSLYPPQQRQHDALDMLKVLCSPETLPVSSAYLPHCGAKCVRDNRLMSLETQQNSKTHPRQHWLTRHWQLYIGCRPIRTAQPCCACTGACYPAIFSSDKQTAWACDGLHTQLMTSLALHLLCNCCRCTACQRSSWLQGCPLWRESARCSFCRNQRSLAWQHMQGVYQSLSTRCTWSSPHSS